MAEEDIFKIFSKRPHARDFPQQEGAVRETIVKSIECGEKIPLVGFWGVGEKANPNNADSATCEFLGMMNQKVKRHHPSGIDFTFIFGTLHGKHNDYDDESIRTYFRGMEPLFRKYDFNFIYLDCLWNKYSISFDAIDKRISALDKDWWQFVENHEEIEKKAKKRNRKFPPLIAAQRYYLMRDFEKHMLETEFKNSIFHTFSDSTSRCVLPDMPTLYLYAREGWSDVPWFVYENE